MAHEKLRQVLAEKDTVLFVGSGISMWSGLPSWPGFIEELATFVEASGANANLVRAEAQRGDLLQAASYGFYELTKPQIGEFVRSACHYGVAKPHEIHRKLVSLGPRCFITTNYDNLIEGALQLWQPDRFVRPPVPGLAADALRHRDFGLRFEGDGHRSHYRPIEGPWQAAFPAHPHGSKPATIIKFRTRMTRLHALPSGPKKRLPGRGDRGTLPTLPGARDGYLRLGGQGRDAPLAPTSTSWSSSKLAQNTGWEFFELEEDLERILGGKVDRGAKRSLVRANALRDAPVIYAA